MYLVFLSICPVFSFHVLRVHYHYIPAFHEILHVLYDANAWKTRYKVQKNAYL